MHTNRFRFLLCVLALSMLMSLMSVCAYTAETDNSAAAQALYDKATGHMTSLCWEPDKALDYATECMQQYPETTQAKWCSLRATEALLQLNKFPEAIEQANETVELAQQLPEDERENLLGWVHIPLAKAYKAMGNPKGYVQNLYKAADLDCNATKSAFDYLALYLWKRMVNEPEEKYPEIGYFDANDSKAWMRAHAILAIGCAQNGDGLHLQKHLDNLTNPEMAGMATLGVARWKAYHSKNQEVLQIAADYADKAATLTSNPRVRIKAMALKAKAAPTVAETKSILENLVEQYPNCGCEHYIQLGHCFEKEENWDEAIRVYDLGAKQPQDGFTYLALYKKGTLLWDKKRASQRARACFNAMEAMGDEYPQGLFHAYEAMALMEAKLGHGDLAWQYAQTMYGVGKKILEAADKSDPSGEKRDRIKNSFNQEGVGEVVTAINFTIAAYRNDPIESSDE